MVSIAFNIALLLKLKYRNT